MRDTREDVSKDNILKKEKVGDKVRVTFAAHDGQRTYEYSGAAARGIMKGRDPGAQTGGKLVEHVKQEATPMGPGKKRFAPVPR